MKRLRQFPWLVLCVSMAVGLAGCDDGVRTLQLQPGGVMRPPEKKGVVILPIWDANPLTPIAKIARDLGLSPDPKEEGRWRRSLSSHSSFTMSLKNVEGGSMLVSLTDSPSSVRSQLSLQAEARIRAALERPTPPITQPMADHITIMAEVSLVSVRDLFRQEEAFLWKPTEAEVAEAADQIRKCLVKSRQDPDFIGYARNDWRFEYTSAKIDEVLAPYSPYSCQVIGLEVAGRKTIAFSFFRAEILEEMPQYRKNLDTQFIRVADGGSGFWRIEFDLATQRFVRFVTNGDA